MGNLKKIEFLKEKAKGLRGTILTMIHNAQSGHPGGSLSIADIITALYYSEANVRPNEPDWRERDRVILSKGHCCPALYGILAMKGYYDYSAIYTLRKLDSILQGHPDMKKTPGVDMTTGSLGQGLSAGVGMAIAAKADKLTSRIFVVMGDGEINEGQVWEAAATAAKYKLDNLIAIVDCNGLQNDGFTKDIMPMNPISSKWEAFGWETTTIDGHNMEEILRAFDYAREVEGKPVCIIAKTIKGKGVSFMENVCEWHGKAPNDMEYEKAISEVKGR